MGLHFLVPPLDGYVGPGNQIVLPSRIPMKCLFRERERDRERERERERERRERWVAMAASPNQIEIEDERLLSSEALSR